MWYVSDYLELEVIRTCATMREAMLFVREYIGKNDFEIEYGWHNEEKLSIICDGAVIVSDYIIN